jgi:hypothetical protein
MRHGAVNADDLDRADLALLDACAANAPSWRVGDRGVRTT